MEEKIVLNTWEWEGVGEYDSPDLVVCADQVERYKGQPVDGVDAVGEQDKPKQEEWLNEVATSFDHESNPCGCRFV